MGAPVRHAAVGALASPPVSPSHLTRCAPPAIGAGRPKLARLTRSGVDLNNHLMSKVPNSSLHWRARTQQWRWVCTRVRSESSIELVLAEGTSRCVLAVHIEAGPGIDASVELDAFEGESLVLAATLRYAGIIAHLTALSLRPWRCVEVLRAPERAELRGAEALRFAFLLSDAPDSAHAAAEADSPLATAGHVRLHRDDASRWHSSTGWRAPPPQALAALPLALQIVVPAPTPFCRAELRALRPGGAVLLGRGICDGLPCALHLPGQVGHAPAALRGGRLVLSGPFTSGPPLKPLHPRKPHMENSSFTAPQPDATDAQAATLEPPADTAPRLANPAFLDELPVALDFHLGQISVSLSDLQAELAEGSVFEIDQPLGAETVSVRAGGLELARGELVQVGDMIAVRITRLASHGSV
jgi:flagellar motor switch/type III secretory pathway protein FliN